MYRSTLAALEREGIKVERKGVDEGAASARTVMLSDFTITPRGICVISMVPTQDFDA